MSLERCIEIIRQASGGVLGEQEVLDALARLEARAGLEGIAPPSRPRARYLRDTLGPAAGARVRNRGAGSCWSVRSHQQVVVAQSPSDEKRA